MALTRADQSRANTRHDETLAGLIEAARMVEVFSTEMKTRYGYSSDQLARMIESARARAGRRTYKDAVRAAAKILEAMRARKGE